MVSAIHSSQNLFLVVSPFAYLITTHEFVYRSWPALHKPRPIEEQAGKVCFFKISYILSEYLYCNSLLTSDFLYAGIGSSIILLPRASIRLRVSVGDPHWLRSKLWEQEWSSIRLFTSFSVHRPAQRECERTGLRSHARCMQSLPNPTTRKGWPHHLGYKIPSLFE